MPYHKPFLKWAGGKFRILPHILPHLSQGKRLIEPFGGSGAVFLNTQFDEYLIGEANFDLVSLYQKLQQEGRAFIEHVRSLFQNHTNQSEFYYQARERFNQLEYGVERSALFIYLNRHGYNGLCRYNQKGIYNVPFGRYVQPYFPEKEMINFHQKSQQAIFLHQDFRASFAQSQAQDVIYCDPPYVPLTPTASFTQYTQHHFNEHDQIELAALAHRTSERQPHTRVIISNHDTPFTREHYRHGTIHRFPVRRFISCHTTSGRHEVMELVAVF